MDGSLLHANTCVGWNWLTILFGNIFQYSEQLVCFFPSQDPWWNLRPHAMLALRCWWHEGIESLSTCQHPHCHQNILLNHSACLPQIGYAYITGEVCIFATPYPYQTQHAPSDPFSTSQCWLPLHQVPFPSPRMQSNPLPWNPSTWNALWHMWLNNLLLLDGACTGTS